MNILFICSSIEPGKDGLGDYTIKLTDELVAVGHAVQIIAISDKYLKDILISNSHSITLTRIPKTLGWSKKYKIIQGQIDRFEPDWVSLQYVSYAFHNKGIPLQLNRMLAKLKGNFKWHILFHETWIGAELNASMKDRIIGLLQRVCIGRLLRSIDPQLVDVTIPLNKVILEHAFNRNVGILPIFSNIAMASGDVNIEISSLNKIIEERRKYIIGNQFGSYYYNSWDLNAFCTAFIEYAQRSNTNPVIIAMGKMSTGSERWGEIEAQYRDKIQFIHTGLLSEEAISFVMQHYTDFGIVTTPAIIAGKSGTFQAFRQHQIPTVLLENNIQMPPYVDINIVLDRDLYYFSNDNKWFDFEQLLVKKSVNFQSSKDIAQLLIAEYIKIDIDS